ncbi:MAG: hypothetical protein J0H83_02370 [Candidatus Melainabacteria bacterium]|nr:hypothetical protein [Candidatus Melainabacteria bacterium]
MKLSFAPALAPILSFAIICAISCDPTTGLPVYAASTSEVSVNRTLDDLEQAISDRRLKQNDIETLAEIVQAHPTDYRAHLLFGLALDEIGMAEQALEQFRLADKYGPQDPRGTAGILSHLMAQGDTVTAKIMLKNALERFPNSQDILYLFGKTLKDNNKHRELAFDVLKKAFLIAPDKPVYRLPSELGELLVASDPRSAYSLASMDLRTHPDYYLGLQVKGESLMQMGLYRQALVPLRKLYAQNPHYGISAQLLTRCLYWDHRYKEALVPALHYLAKEAKYKGLGAASGETFLVLSHNSKPQDVQNALSQFYAEASKNKIAITPAFHYYLAVVFYKCHWGQMAQNEIDKFIALEPGDADAYFIKARINERFLDDYDAALKNYMIASGRSPYNLEYAQAAQRLAERLETRNNDWAWCLRDWLRRVFS